MHREKVDYRYRLYSIIIIPIRNITSPLTIILRAQAPLFANSLKKKTTKLLKLKSRTLPLKIV